MGRLKDRFDRRRYYEQYLHTRQPTQGEEEEQLDNDYEYEEQPYQYEQIKPSYEQSIDNQQIVERDFYNKYQPQLGSIQHEQAETEINTYDNPLSILDEIKKQPSPKGTLPVMIGGRPLDLHALEDYVVKVSPYHLRTILRYHNARTIEEIKNYSQRFGMTKIKGSTIFIILLAIGMGVLGLVLMMFMPQIIGMFTGGF